MKGKHFLLGGTLSAALLISYLHAGLVESAEVKKDKAPEFALKTFDKGEIKLAGLQGKAVVLKFMASW
ncbi:MAG: peroxiredoxin family protein [Candidatus Binatia bacterium]